MARMSTTVDSGDLNQAPPKQTAVCSTCIIPVPPVNCQFIWIASTFGMRATHNQTYLGVTLYRTLSYREHLTKTADKLKNRNNLLMKLAGSTWGTSANTLRSSALVLCYSAAEYCAQSGHALLTQVRSMCSWTLPRVSSLVPSILHIFHGFQRSPTLNCQPYEGRLPLTSWWRKSSNMTVGQCSLIYLAHHCYDWHPGSRCG